MSALNGTSSSYFAIRDIHNGSNLSSGWDQEYEFLSGTDNKNMLTWGQYMNYILYDKIPVKPNESLSVLRKAVDEQYKDSPGFKPKTVYDVIQSMPNTRKMAKLIKDSGYKKLSDVNYPVTFLVPTDEHFDEFLGPYLNMGVFRFNAFQTVRYHTLPYYVEPGQLKGRKYKLQTDLDKQPVESNWVGDKHLIVSQDTPFPGGIYGFFPVRSWDVPVLGYVECEGGIVYIIDRPLVFPPVL